MCLISDGSRADKPSITLGKAEIEGDRALIGLVLSNYILSPLRVGTEELGAVLLKVHLSSKLETLRL